MIVVTSALQKLVVVSGNFIAESAHSSIVTVEVWILAHPFAYL